ncbi:hypothetical protein HELRODRAFT_175923 [Helobdella robusta]|uniref:Uncharacterized protein n=1 Tax=Helobdella robusta TaxID=6412 RepID=T1F9W4_HELRO|nr:hypothetical protein HELRODRAFT_175923 [Helobdella robusta]ESO00485.1 hypothetical protein HELRODRAFT_175923 [Helobdella robusta]
MAVKEFVCDKKRDVLAVSESRHYFSDDVCLIRSTPKGYTCFNKAREEIKKSSLSGSAVCDSGVYLHCNVEELFDLCDSTLRQIVDQHAPLVNKRVRSKSCRWRQNIISNANELKRLWSVLSSFVGKKKVASSMAPSISAQQFLTYMKSKSEPFADGSDAPVFRSTERSLW